MDIEKEEKGPKEEQGKIILPEGHRHGLNDGEYVTFCEVEGMTELNGNTYKVTTVGPF